MAFMSDSSPPSPLGSAIPLAQLIEQLQDVLTMWEAKKDGYSAILFEEAIATIKGAIREAEAAVRGAAGPSEAQDVVEALAALAHEQWSGWMRHLFSRCDSRPTLAGMTARIPAGWAERWMRQMNTPYAELTEAEKESDRNEARRVLDVLQLLQRVGADRAPAGPSEEKPDLAVDEALALAGGCDGERGALLSRLLPNGWPAGDPTGRETRATSGRGVGAGSLDRVSVANAGVRAVPREEQEPK